MGEVTEARRWTGARPPHQWTTVSPRGRRPAFRLPESPYVASLDRTGVSRGRFGGCSRPAAPPRPTARTQRTRERPHPPSRHRSVHDPTAPPALSLHRIWYTGQPAPYVVNRYTGTIMRTGLSRPPGRYVFHVGLPDSGPLSPRQHPHVSSPPRRTRTPDRCRTRSSPAASTPLRSTCICRPRRRRGRPSHLPAGSWL